MIKPQRLKAGDTATVVSLSHGMLGEPEFLHKFHIARDRMEREYGVRLIAMPHALDGIDRLYRHPELRAQDLMDAFRDPEIKAVFSAIGGDDTIRLLPYIDFDVLRGNPKIFTGFSDTTVNHLMMYKAGLVSYYGLSVMCDIAEYVGMNEYSKAMMEKTLFDPQPRLDIPCSDFCSWEDDKVLWSEENSSTPIPRFPNTGYELLQGSGAVTGELLGGCADTFIYLMGTPLWPSPDDWRGKLLLMETSEEDLSADELTWILRNLQAQGVLSVIRGIVAGKPAYRGRDEAYKDVYRKVVGFEAGRPDLPILFNVNVGHAYPIGVLPLGLPYEIDCERKTLTLLEPAAL